MPLPIIPPHPHAGIRPVLLSWLKTPKFRFAARTPRDALTWQRSARRRLAKLLTVPFAPVPLRPKVLEVVPCNGYTRTQLTYQTAPGMRAVAWWCVPDGFDPAGNSPAVIATPGHGYGGRELLALDEQGNPRTEGMGYQKDYALQAVRLGYPTLVVEPLGFGVRRDASMVAQNKWDSGCHVGSTLATMLGTTLAAIRVNDLRCGLDWLEGVRGIDARRVAIIGISGGGQLTLWTAAVDPRFAAAGVSGYLNTFRGSIMSVFHCQCNMVPGLAVDFEMSDLAALVAPRPLLVESGSTDDIFPIAHTRAALRDVKRAYGVFKAQTHLHTDLFEGGHQWSGVRLNELLGSLQTPAKPPVRAGRTGRD